MKKPLLEKQVCDALLRELTNYEAQATCLSLPCTLFSVCIFIILGFFNIYNIFFAKKIIVFYRHDENIGALEKCGFAPILAQLVRINFFFFLLL